MSTSIIIGSIAVIMLIIGIVIGRILARQKSTSDQWKWEKQVSEITFQRDHLSQMLKKKEDEFDSRMSTLKEERNEIRQKKDELQTALTQCQTKFLHLQEKNREQKTEVEQLQQKFHTEFENLANKILEHKSEKFTKLNKENIRRILDPLQDKIKGFEEKVEKSEKDSLKRHTELGEQLKNLNEQNAKISREAINLTKALKGDSKMQGDWGEMILERVLEQSGLQKGREYEVQKSLKTVDHKHLRPDVVIFLPGDKKMIVDSKVSLVAYERYINSAESKERSSLANQHLKAIRKHVEELSQKNYQQFYAMESPDFVLMFIPVESAFALASHAYPQLYGDAFDRQVIIVTPTTLLAVLKTIDSMWQNEKQKQNALDIATQAGKLYDQFVNLTEELQKIDLQLGTVQKTYDRAMVKLTGRGNLVGKVEQLKKLGAKAHKQIDQRLIKRTENPDI